MKQIFLLLLLLSLAQTHGQVPGAAPGIPSSTARYPRPAPNAIDPVTGQPISDQSQLEEPRFDIRFPGGTPEDLIAVVQDSSKQRPNVVIHPDCSQNEVPPFILRDVTISQIFNTLNSLAEPEFAQGHWKQVPMKDGQVWTLTKVPKSNRVYPGMGMSINQFGQPIPAPAQRSCKIFNLTPYLEDFTVEDLTTSIQGAWDLLKSDSDPTIKYHKETKLLIVVGSTADLSVVADVLQQLNPSIAHRNPQAAAASTQSTNKSVIQPKHPEPK